VLISLSEGYPPIIGRLHTRYAPVRRSPPGISTCAAPRLACVKPVASVHPEPGSNSSLYKFVLFLNRYTRYRYRVNRCLLKDAFFRPPISLSGIGMSQSFLTVSSSLTFPCILHLLFIFPKIAFTFYYPALPSKTDCKDTPFS
jgi:hypothetical protein